MEKQKVSVILATYNGSTYIKEQLDSIVSQTIKPDEIIVVDDCSKDNTKEIIKTFIDAHPNLCFLFVNKDNCGVSKTFESAAMKAKGDVIFFSDQDDVWLNNKIEKTMEAFNHYRADFVFTNAFIVNECLNNNNQTLWTNVNFVPKDQNDYIIYDKNELVFELLKHNVVTGMTMACTKSLLNKCFPFPSFLLHDYWLALNASLSGKMVAVNIPLVLYRQHSMNVVGVGKKRSLSNKQALKKHYLTQVDYLISLYKVAYDLCLKYNACHEFGKEVYGYYVFANRRKKALNKSVFDICKLKKDYNKFTYKGNRYFKKDIYYTLFLKRK